jgi:hypothetical protein
MTITLTQDRADVARQGDIEVGTTPAMITLKQDNDIVAINWQHLQDLIDILKQLPKP